MNISIFNGAGQSDYLYGLVSGLTSTPVKQINVLDIDLASGLFESLKKTRFYDVYRYQKKGSSYSKKAVNIVRFYYLQAKYLLFNKPHIIHFQWLDRYYFIDRILLPTLSKIRGHKTILTVHNVNAGKRDNRDTTYNRFTLSMAYKLCDHLIVHTPKSKQELIDEFDIPVSKISVIKHGMNNKVANIGITQLQARTELKIGINQKVVLFFGNIDYYKGLDILLDSFNKLSSDTKKEIVLLIAGNYKSKEYYDQIRSAIDLSELKSQIIAHFKFIPDESIEKYFMAADCIVLPYRDIYQSGVLFMAYNFGLPAIATNVGNFSNDIIENKTGFIAEDISVNAVSNIIEKYFASALYQNLAQTRQDIRQWSNRVYSWDAIGKDTYKLYKHLLSGLKDL